MDPDEHDDLRSLLLSLGLLYCHLNAGTGLVNRELRLRIFQNNCPRSWTGPAGREPTEIFCGCNTEIPSWLNFVFATSTLVHGGVTNLISKILHSYANAARKSTLSISENLALMPRRLTSLVDVTLAEKTPKRSRLAHHQHIKLVAMNFHSTAEDRTNGSPRIEILLANKLASSIALEPRPAAAHLKNSTIKTVTHKIGPATCLAIRRHQSLKQKGESKHQRCKRSLRACLSPTIFFFVFKACKTLLLDGCSKGCPAQPP